MKISAIKQQLNQPNRYSVFAEGKYIVSLSADALLASKLTVGQELSGADLTWLKKLSEDDKAYSLTLGLIARRMRSVGELQDYFKRKGYGEDLAESILSRLRDAGLVDDREFARRWVENRRSLKHMSDKKLELELKQKRIDSGVIREVLAETDTDERELLKDLVAKKRRLSRYQDSTKLMQYLARQGFSYDDIKAVLASEGGE